MSESIATHHYAHAMRDVARRHQVLLGAFLIVLMGVLTFAILQPIADVARGAFFTQTAATHPVMEFPAREIPRDWQWRPKGVDVEYMYRQYPSQRLDWIQEGGSR